ncbi:hypothetical protein QYF36_017802 [Acer negundo]|nr:hypothetical protein QYF36_017802 [Acer negundo]
MRVFWREYLWHVSDLQRGFRGVEKVRVVVTVRKDAKILSCFDVSKWSRRKERKTRAPPLWEVQGHVRERDSHITTLTWWHHKRSSPISLPFLKETLSSIPFLEYS